MDESADDHVLELGLQAPGSQATVPDPKGAYFADVIASGTGCPAGTWRTEISDDGLTFTTYFEAYDLEIDEQKQMALKDCTLAVKLRSPSGMSYTITDFYYEGYAILEQGVRARQTASYYFQGMPTLSTEKRTDLVGPVDESYLFQDSVGTADLVWSPCGLERLLNVKTNLRLTNSSPRRSGIITLSSVNATTDTKVVFKLNYRKCDSGANAGSGTQTGGTGSTGGGGSNRGGRGRR